VGRPGNVLRRSGGPGGCSEAVGGVLMVVDDDIVVVDGSCAAVASGDVAHVGGVDELVWVVWVLASTRMAISSFLDFSVSVLPTSRPSSNPFLLPSSKIEALPFSRVLAIVVFTRL
jgi:hypothetical protein